MYCQPAKFDFEEVGTASKRCQPAFGRPVSGAGLQKHRGHTVRWNGKLYYGQKSGCRWIFCNPSGRHLFFHIPSHHSCGHHIHCQWIGTFRTWLAGLGLLLSAGGQECDGIFEHRAGNRYTGSRLFCGRRVLWL